MARRLLDAVISALSAVVTAGVALLASWITAFGPVGVPASWLTPGLVGGLWMIAMILLVFGSARHFGGRWVTWVAVIGSFFALGFTVMQVPSAVEARAFQLRGKVTTCTVAAVKERQVTTTDANGDSTTTTVYDHRLACPRAHVGTMTAESPVAKKGKRLRVRYDPTHRLGPQLAGTRMDVDGATRTVLITLAVAVVLRMLLDLFPDRTVDSPFGAGNGMERVRRGMVVSGIALVVVFGLVTCFHLLSHAADASLRLVGVPAGLRHSALLRWPVTAAIGYAVNYVLGLGRHLLVRVLRGFGGRLDPDGGLGAMVATADLSTTISLPFLGGIVSMDTGFLGWVKNAVVARFRRRTTGRHRA